MTKKIELMAPAGSLANLKAAVSQGADSVYFGLKNFNARAYATNFSDNYLPKVVHICKSNNVKMHLTMNTSIKNQEIKPFFIQLEFAYSKGIDAVIVQDFSFIDIIKKSFPDLRVHVSTQAGVINSLHANFLKKADRINLARELTKEEIKFIRERCNKELEMFVHGALCVSLSGSCLFSSFIGGRSGNRGRCAQPCRRIYDSEYFLSTKDLNLIRKITEIIEMGIDALKIEGRMRTPYYVATVTKAYRKAIDSYYAGNFEVNAEMINQLKSAFNREYTEGWYSSADVFNRRQATGKEETKKVFYEVDEKKVIVPNRESHLKLPQITTRKSEIKRLLVRAYSKKDALEAAENGADIIYYDLFKEDFADVKSSVKVPVYGVTPRIFSDDDKEILVKAVFKKKPAGLFIGNWGVVALNFNVPLHFDYNLNCYNDFNLAALPGLPVISPELNLKELSEFKNKNFAVLVHGRIRLMTLRHALPEKVITDEKGYKFIVRKIPHGTEIFNEKEIGLWSKSQELLNSGINNFYIDTDHNVGKVVNFYRQMMDGKKVNDNKLKKDYVLGWFFKGVE